MKFFGSPSRTHSVNLNDDHTGIRDRMAVAITGSERFGDVMIVWPGIDVFDNRVFFGRIKINRPVNDSPDIGFAISTLGDKPFG